MEKKLIQIAALFAAVMVVIWGYAFFLLKDSGNHESIAGQVVALNEIEQLMKLESAELWERQIEPKTTALRESLRAEQQPAVGTSERLIVTGMAGLCILFLILVFSYIYYAILRPFRKMKDYAGKIANGNFDVPLEYERSNYFGDFTWAFDNMRREITKARACEREAIDNNKTVIATLSHDIKAPMSSIRAYAEGLEANLNGTVEKRAKYLGVIMKKCDEVSRLTNDLFLHSLSDLNKLEFNLEPVELGAFLNEILTELTVEQQDIAYDLQSFRIPATILVDRNRFVQVMENLIHNARKYARTKIEITMQENERDVCICVRDYGKGIPDTDLPFIFEKFYRGANCGQESGSGLGLYIVKYITEQMKGDILLHNHEDGLEVLLYFPKA